MQRALVLLLLLILSLVPPAPFTAPAAAAAGGAGTADGSPAAESGPAPATREGAASAGAGVSPWEHPLWNNATTMMRLYVCDYARRPPSWCEGPRELPADAELPEPLGPPLMEVDARWLDFLARADPANLSPADVAGIRSRAVERRDPQAMEMLGYLYAQGLSVERDYVEAYRWYGLAYLAGEQRVRPNMDVVWQQLQRHDLEGALALTREFDALSRGEVPAGMMPPPAAPGGSGPQSGPAAALPPPASEPAPGPPGESAAAAR
jgi:hypothetical protein